MWTALTQLRGGKRLIGFKALYLSGFIILALVSLVDYVPWTSPVFLLAIVAITITSGKKTSQHKIRYAIAALVILLISFLVPVKTLFFFSIAFSVFYWLEIYKASIRFWGVIAMLIASPVFEYVANVFSFPIRLKLAGFAGYLFSLFQSNVIVRGNTIVHNGKEFSVDPACMGLSMLSISLLSGIILIGFLQRKTGKILSWRIGMIYLLGLLVLNIVANLIRIVVLVQFTIMPESFMHSVTGLVCLLLYVCFPAVYLAKFLITTFGKEGFEITKPNKKSSSLLLKLLLLGLTVASIRILTVDTYRRFDAVQNKSFGEYSVFQFAPGVLKLEKPGSLIYIKFIRGFYDTDHNPTICWKGSGYEFKEIRKQQIAKREVYTASLTNGKEALYTAWWYGNDKHATIDQWQWRMDMLKGAKNYAVINVTTESQALLYNDVEKIIQEQDLATLFSNLK